MAQLVKNPPAIWETWVWTLGWEDPLEKGMATYYIILAWRSPWRIPYSSWGRKESDKQRSLSLFTISHTNFNSIFFFFFAAAFF